MSARSIIPARRNLWWMFFALGAFVCALYVFVPPLKGSVLVINGLGLYGVLALIAGIRLYRPRARVAWWLFVLGVFLFWVGDVYTYSVRVLFDVTVPFPSFGDAVYLTMYPVLMVGIMLLVRRRNQRADGPGAVDALIMTLGLALVSGIILIAPYVHDKTLGLLPKLVSIGYPMGDIILLAAGIRLAVDGGKRRPAFYLLIAGIVSMLVTDDTYGVLTLHNAFTHQLWLDAGWIFFYLFWGAAALHPSMQELSDVEVDREPRLTPLRLALLAGATLVAPALEIIKVIPTRNWDFLVVVGASAVLFSLVVARMTGLVRQREKSVSRERALSAAGGLLVAATAPQEIVTAALQAVADFGNDRVDARVCQISCDEEHAMALDVDGHLTDWAIPDDVSSLLQTAGGSTVSKLPADAREQLRLPAGDDPVLLLELRPAGPANAGLVLVLDGEAAYDDETRYALRSLAHQVALALSSSELSAEVHRRASEARFATLVQNSSDLITAGEATTRHQLANIDLQRGNYEHARTECLAVLELRRELGDRAGEAVTRHQLASIDVEQGNYEQARTEYLAVLELERELGDRAGEATTRHQLANIDVEQGNYEQARTEYLAVLELERELGDRAGEATTRHQLANIDYQRGNHEQARTEYLAVLELRRELVDRRGERLRGGSRESRSAPKQGTSCYSSWSRAPNAIGRGNPARHNPAR